MNYFLLLLILFNCQNEEKRELDKPKFIKSELTPSVIDSLHSLEEIQRYINKIKYPFKEVKISEDSIRIDRKFEKFELKRISEFDRNCKGEPDRDSLTKSLADSLKIKNSFYKSDFDNNGFTDLLVIGDRHICGGLCLEQESISCDFSVYALMNFGNDSINPIDLNFITKSESLVPKVINDENGSRIELHRPKNYRFAFGKKIPIEKSRTLVYRYGSFIEKNDYVKTYDIQNIEFISNGCGAGCPEFVISIDKNKNGKLNALNYNWLDKDYSNKLDPSDIEGEYRTTISEQSFEEIFGIINHLDFPSLENEYISGSMHSSYCTLKITYGKGKVKTIVDEDMIGTFGLKRVYKMFFDLRFNQDWK